MLWYDLSVCCALKIKATFWRTLTIFNWYDFMKNQTQISKEEFSIQSMPEPYLRIYMKNHMLSEEKCICAVVFFIDLKIYKG